jgi:hypothetical protein
MWFAGIDWCTGYLGRPFLERKKMGVNEEQEESSLVGRMLIELVSSGSLAEQEARLHTQLGPRGCVPRSPLDREQGKRKKTCPRLLAGLGQIAEPTGTDGHRCLSHQRSLCLFPHMETSISKCNLFYLSSN